MRIGIITHYYKSKNYGGNLQAYAMCRVLQQLGYDAEQIAYENKKTFRTRAKHLFLLMKNFKHPMMNKALFARNRRIMSFNKEKIPHSRIVYDSSTVAKSVREYDAFLTGSDQVWNPRAYCPAYGLEFVLGDKIKLSYAASIAADSIEVDFENILKRALDDFDAISLREEKGVELVSRFCNKDVQLNVDPTLLLTREEWDSVSSDRIILEPYVFCHVLSDNESIKHIAEDYANKRGMKLVCIPFLREKFSQFDSQHKNESVMFSDPADFISLVRFSEAVFTDSFHAVAFSCIYHKQFYAFDRVIGTSQGSRIKSLAKLIGAEKHFCSKKEEQNGMHIEYIPSIDYTNIDCILSNQRKKSIIYLQQNIGKAENNGTQSG